MRKFIDCLLLVALLIAFLAAGCSQPVLRGSRATPDHDGRYDIGFPTGNDWEALEAVLETVRLINATASYSSYSFDRSEQVTLHEISPQLLGQHHIAQEGYHDFAVGTATVIYADHNKVAVMTCAHVVDFPDTVATYYEEPDAGGHLLLQNIAIKRQQKNSITDMRQGEDFEILAIDHELDVAVLGKTFLYTTPDVPPVFRYPAGRAAELKWGTFVYLIGFPSGKKMLTSGIISSPDRNKEHGFLVDALFNRGFSGGIVLALRDGIPNFELVGLVNAVVADEEQVLVPARSEKNQPSRFAEPYRNDIYVGHRKIINYGITFGISMEAILDFIQRNRASIENAGFRIDTFFRR